MNNSGTIVVIKRDKEHQCGPFVLKYFRYKWKNSVKPCPVVLPLCKILPYVFGLEVV